MLSRPDSERPLTISFHVSSDYRAGTYFRYHNLARGLVELGHHVTVHSQSVRRRDRATRELREGVQYILPASCPGNGWIDFPLNPGNITRRAFSTVPTADVYHLFQPFENAALEWQWLRFRRATERALFAWDWDDLWFGGFIELDKRGANFPRWRETLLGMMERWLPKKAELVTTCSAYLGALARERGAHDTATIHNGFWPGISHSASENSSSERLTARTKFGLRPKAFYLGFIGWTPVAVDWCFDVLRHFPSKPGLPEVRLVCGGYDVSKMLPGNTDIADRVDYLGSLAPADARELMAALDLGLLPLTATPFNESRLPIKFAEYLAAGIPQVCGDIGEVSALGRKLDGVVLAPPEQTLWVDQCADVVKRLLKDPTALRPSRLQLENHLSWPVLAKRLESHYRQAIDTNHQNAAR